MYIISNMFSYYYMGKNIRSERMIDYSIFNEVLHLHLRWSTTNRNELFIKDKDKRDTTLCAYDTINPTCVQCPL